MGVVAVAFQALHKQVASPVLHKYFVLNPFESRFHTIYYIYTVQASTYLLLIGSIISLDMCCLDKCVYSGLCYAIYKENKL